MGCVVRTQSVYSARIRTFVVHLNFGSSYYLMRAQRIPAFLARTHFVRVCSQVFRCSFFLFAYKKLRYRSSFKFHPLRYHFFVCFWESLLKKLFLNERKLLGRFGHSGYSIAYLSHLLVYIHMGHKRVGSFSISLCCPNSPAFISFFHLNEEVIKEFILNSCMHKQRKINLFYLLLVILQAKSNQLNQSPTHLVYIHRL